MNWIPIAGAAMSLVVILLSYGLMKRTNRYGLGALALPLALLAILPAWAIGAYQATNAFRTIALLGNGDLNGVAGVFRDFTRSVMTGHQTSALLLLVVLVLGAALLLRGQEDTPSAAASGFRSAVIMTMALLPVLATAGLSELGTRALTKPAAVLRAVAVLDGAQLPVETTDGAPDLTANNLSAMSAGLAEHFVLLVVLAFLVFLMTVTVNFALN